MEFLRYNKVTTNLFGYYSARTIAYLAEVTGIAGIAKAVVVGNVDASAFSDASSDASPFGAIAVYVLGRVGNEVFSRYRPGSSRKDISDKLTE